MGMDGLMAEAASMPRAEAGCPAEIASEPSAATMAPLSVQRAGGGVAANSRLREMAKDRAAKAGLELRIPPASLCTDNGAMVAALGAELLRKGVKPSGLGIAVDSSASVSVISF